jgi:hypothetical protein
MPVVLAQLGGQINRDVGTRPWPTGPYFRGDVYSSHVNMLVPFDELNNPRFSEQMPAGSDPSIP